MARLFILIMDRIPSIINPSTCRRTAHPLPRNILPTRSNARRNLVFQWQRIRWKRKVFSRSSICLRSWLRTREKEGHLTVFAPSNDLILSPPSVPIRQRCSVWLVPRLIEREREGKTNNWIWSRSCVQSYVGKRRSPSMLLVCLTKEFILFLFSFLF